MENAVETQPQTLAQAGEGVAEEKKDFFAELEERKQKAFESFLKDAEMNVIKYAKETEAELVDFSASVVNSTLYVVLNYENKNKLTKHTLTVIADTGFNKIELKLDDCVIPSAKKEEILSFLKEIVYNISKDSEFLFIDSVRKFIEKLLNDEGEISSFAELFKMLDDDTIKQLITTVVSRATRDTRNSLVEAVFLLARARAETDEFLTFEQLIMRFDREKAMQGYSKNTIDKTERLLQRLADTGLIEMRHEGIFTLYRVGEKLLSEMLGVMKSNDKTDSVSTLSLLLDYIVENIKTKGFATLDYKNKTLVIDVEKLIASMGENVNTDIINTILTRTDELKELILYKKNSLKNVVFTNSVIKKRLHDVTTADVEKLIDVYAVVSASAERKAFLKKAVFICKDCGHKFSVNNYIHKKFQPPRQCPACGSRNIFLSDKDSEYVDLTELILEDDVQLLGMKESKQTMSAYLKKRFDLQYNKLYRFTVIVRVMEQNTNKRQLVLEIEDVHTVEDEELDKIKNLDEELKELLTKSDDERLEFVIENFAPNIIHSKDKSDWDLYQAYIMKKMMLLSFVSDKRKDVDGDLKAVNTLIVGEKGTGKTTLANFLEENAGAVFKSLEESTSAGLIGTVEQREGFGWVFRPGPILLANRNTLILDEIDKLDDDVSKRLLGVLSKGRLHVAKATINTSFEDIISLIAMMNPISRKIDRTRDVFKQIKQLRPEFLDRFTFIFFVSMNDKKTIEKILDAELEKIGKTEEQDRRTKELWGRYLRYVRDNVHVVGYTTEAKEKMREYLKKIIDEFDDAQNDVSFSYSTRLIKHFKNAVESHAKLRASNVVEEKDVEAVIELYDAMLLSWGIKSFKEFVEKTDDTITTEELEELEELAEEAFSIISAIETDRKTLRSVIKGIRNSITKEEADELINKLERAGFVKTEGRRVIFTTKTPTLLDFLANDESEIFEDPQ